MFFNVQELPKNEEPAVPPAAVKITPLAQERLPAEGTDWLHRSSERLHSHYSWSLMGVNNIQIHSFT